MSHHSSKISSHNRFANFFKKSTGRVAASVAKKHKQKVALQCAIEPLQPRMLLSAVPLTGFASYVFDEGAGNIQEIDSSGNVAGNVTLDYSGNTTYTVGNSTANGGVGDITVVGNVTGNTSYTLTSSSISFGNLSIGYDSTFTTLNLSNNNGNPGFTVDDAGGNDTVSIGSGSVTFGGVSASLSDASSLTVNATGGNNTIDLNSANVATTLNGDSSTIFNVGQAGEGLNAIADATTVNAGGGVVNLLPSEGNSTLIGTLSAGYLSGFSGAGVGFTGESALNISLTGPGSTLHVTGLNGNTTINSNGDTIDANPVEVDNFEIEQFEDSFYGDTLAVNGSGNDTLNYSQGEDFEDNAGNLTLNATTIAGQDSITYSGLSNLNITSGDDLDEGQNLTVNQTAGNTTTVINTGEDLGGGNVTVVNDSGPLTITDNSEEGNIHVEDDGGATTINDNSEFGTITLDNDHATTIINSGEGFGDNNVTINNDSATTTVTTNGEDSQVTLNNDGGATTINDDTQLGGNITVAAVGAATTLNGNVNLTGAFSSYLAPITCTGNATEEFDESTLVVTDNDAVSRRITLGNDHISGGGMTTGGISYSGYTNVGITGGSGSDLTTITGDDGNATTTFNTGTGANTVILTGDTGALNVNLNGNSSVADIRAVGAATSFHNTTANPAIFNVGGFNAGGGSLTNIQGALTLTGNGSDYAHIDSTADTSTEAGTLTGSTLTGLGMGNGSIAYSGLSLMKLWLGAGGDNLTVDGTSATATQIRSGSGNPTVNVQATGNNTATTIFTNTGSSTINAGDSGSSIGDGVLSNLAGNVTIVGSGHDTLLTDDSGDTGGGTGTLTGSSLTGFGSAGIGYTGVSNLKTWLGAGNTTLTIDGTNGNATTHVQAFSTGSTVDVAANAGNTTINVGGGNLTTASTVNVGFDGSFAQPLSQIGGNITLIGSSDSTLNVNGSATGNETGLLTSSNLYDFDLNTPLDFIRFGNVSTLFGAGNNTLNITGANPGTAYTFTGGNGTNTASFNFPGDLNDHYSLTNFGNTTVAVTGNDTGSIVSTGSITSATIGGNFSSGADIVGESGVGNLTVGGTNLGHFGTSVPV